MFIAREQGSVRIAVVQVKNQIIDSMYYSKIIVQHSDGSKAQGAKVALSISGLLSGGVTQNVYTDRFGEALIPHERGGSAKVLVNGTARATIQAPGETVVFV